MHGSIRLEKSGAWTFWSNAGKKLPYRTAWLQTARKVRSGKWRRKRKGFVQVLWRYEPKSSTPYRAHSCTSQQLCHTVPRAVLKGESCWVRMPKKLLVWLNGKTLMVHLPVPITTLRQSNHMGTRRPAWLSRGPVRHQHVLYACVPLHTAPTHWWPHQAGHARLPDGPSGTTSVTRPETLGNFCHVYSLKEKGSYAIPNWIGLWRFYGPPPQGVKTFWWGQVKVLTDFYKTCSRHHAAEGCNT